VYYAGLLCLNPSVLIIVVRIKLPHIGKMVTNSPMVIRVNTGEVGSMLMLVENVINSSNDLFMSVSCAMSVSAVYVVGATPNAKGFSRCPRC
jgi:hypothetical protein